MTFWRVAYDDALYRRNPGELAVYAPDAETARATAVEYLKNETLYARPHVVTAVVEVVLTRPAVFEACEGLSGEWPRLHREPGPGEEDTSDRIPHWHLRMVLPEAQTTDDVLARVRSSFRDLLAKWPTGDDELQPVWEVREDLRFGRGRTLALVELGLHQQREAARDAIPPLLDWASRTADEHDISWQVSLDDDDIGIIVPGQPISEEIRAAVSFETPTDGE